MNEWRYGSCRKSCIIYELVIHHFVFLGLHSKIYKFYFYLYINPVEYRHSGQLCYSVLDRSYVQNNCSNGSNPVSLDLTPPFTRSTHRLNTGSRLRVTPLVHPKEKGKKYRGESVTTLHQKWSRSPKDTNSGRLLVVGSYNVPPQGICKVGHGYGTVRNKKRSWRVVGLRHIK